MVRRVVIALSWFVALPGFATAQSMTEAIAFARRVAGCYELVPGPWRADSVRAGDVSTLDTPAGFELTVERLKDWEPLQSKTRPLFRARALPPKTPTQGWFTYWQWAGGSSDTLEISEPLRMAGVALKLAPDGHDLAGQAIAFTDAVPIGSPSEVERPVRARRATCPR